MSFFKIFALTNLLVLLANGVSASILCMRHDDEKKFRLEFVDKNNQPVLPIASSFVMFKASPYYEYSENYSGAINYNTDGKYVWVTVADNGKLFKNMGSRLWANIHVYDSKTNTIKVVGNWIDTVEPPIKMFDYSCFP
jgi:hypothetical protein